MRRLHADRLQGHAARVHALEQPDSGAAARAIAAIIFPYRNVSIEKKSGDRQLTIATPEP